MIKLICKVCSKDIWTFPSRKDRKKYCSKKCFYKRKIVVSQRTKRKMKIAGKRNARLGKNKGCFKKGQNLGKNHPMWKGGIIINTQGYAMVYSPNHPFCDKNKKVRRSRLVMEKHIGRYLKPFPQELVHHKNEIKTDDRIENLKLCEGVKGHKAFHRIL